MTNTRNDVFSKAILILANKRKTEGISYTFVTVDVGQGLVFLRTVRQVNHAPREAIFTLTREVC